MAKGLFVTGFTVAEVLAIQTEFKGLIGKTVMSWTDAETSASKQFGMPPAQVLEECAYALKVLDPATYGRPRIAGASYVSGFLAR